MSAPTSIQMANREAMAIVQRHGREVRFHWQGSDLIRSCYDAAVWVWRETTVGNCYDASKLQVERTTWANEAADCEEIALCQDPE